MHAYLRNVVFKLLIDHFIQCPFSKLIHHNMTFWSSKFLLEQVSALDNKDEANRFFTMSNRFRSTHQN